VTAIIRYLVERSLVVNLISVFVVVLGLFAATHIRREAFPPVNFDLIRVEIPYPGATPEEVEHLIISPIEQELKSINGIDKMTAIAFPGQGRILLEVDPDSANRGRIVSDVQVAVDRSDLPRDLPDNPLVQEIDNAVFPIIRLAITAPLPPFELKHVADRIEDDLLQVPGVARLVIQAERKGEIRVVVDPKKLAQQRISVGEIATALSKWNVNSPGGELETPEGEFTVRVVGEFKSARDAADVVLRANDRGDIVRLADVATVTETLERPRVITDVSGRAGISMIVLKKADADIIKTIDNIRNYLKLVPERYGAEVKVTPFQDWSYFTRLRLGVLTNNALVGIVLVFFTLLLFLRPSVALTTTWGLPIIFLGGLYALWSFGFTLNLVSMMGFIIVLGMLVDDAIVIGENITYHMEQRMKPVEAAVLGTVEMMGPVTTTVMTTVVAFLPLAFMTGIIGKFVLSIPIVVISLLILSWLESFLVLPAHVVDVTNPHKHPPERRWLTRLEERYGALLEIALDHRWLTLLLSVLVLIGSFILARTSVSFQLFPPVAVDQYIIRITAPPGTSVTTMQQRLLEVDTVLRASIEQKHIEATLLTSGETAIDEGDPLTQRGGRFGQIRVVYTPAVTRPNHNALEDMRAVEEKLPAKFPTLTFAFSEIKPGPPTGRPLEVEISSFDAAASDTAAQRLMDFLRGVKGVTSVDSGQQPGDAELHVVLDRAQATYAGLDLATAAQHIRAAVGGLVVSTTRRGTKEIDVTIRYPENVATNRKLLEDLLIPNSRGGLVPLQRIAKFEQHPGLTAIRHKDGIRVVNVTADINTRQITSAGINRLVAAQAATWLGDVANKVTLKYGGEAEKNEESFRGLKNSFAFAAIGILFILAIQFNNLAYPFIVMLAIPFGVVGIIISFYLHDLLWKPMPLSFFSTMGMVALSGVVVNSSLILLVFIQRAMAQGVRCREAIVTAGRRRLRAVLLTAGTTVMGLLPTAYGWGGLDPFVSPMALALSSGLIFATLITLIVIPAVLACGIDAKAWLLKEVRPIGSRLHGRVGRLTDRFISKK